MSKGMADWKVSQYGDGSPALPPVRSEPLFGASALKAKISAILASVMDGSAKQYRTEDGIYIRWGLVERDIHAAIDASNAKDEGLR